MLPEVSLSSKLSVVIDVRYVTQLAVRAELGHLHRAQDTLVIHAAGKIDRLSVDGHRCGTALLVEGS